MKKKVFWIFLLLLFIIAIAGVVIIAQPKQNEERIDESEVESNKFSDIENKEEKKEYEKIELEDGTLYAAGGEQLKTDMVIGDNYFDTTISDMYLNPEDYYGMNIEIEGMYLTDGKYTSVGRYSTSSLCQYCPAGYSFIEYQLEGDIDKDLVAEKDWIKVVGTLQKANDATSFYQDYFYIKATNIEIMKEKGNDTVNN